MSARVVVALLAAVVVAGLIGLAVLLRPPEPATSRSAAPSDADEFEVADRSAARGPSEPRNRRPSSGAIQPLPPSPPADMAGGGRYADDDGHLVADHRGEPPPDRPLSPLRGARASIKKSLRPIVHECAQALSDPVSASGAVISVTVVIKVQDGQFVVTEPRAASKTVRDEPFFACIGKRLDGHTVAAPEGQDNSISAQVTFPYRVP